MNNLNMNDIRSLSCAQQQDLYQRCKYLLRTKAGYPEAILHKYKKLLESNIGNKYYTYFYSRLIIKEYMASELDNPLTAEDINLVIEEHEKDIEYFKQYK